MNRITMRQAFWIAVGSSAATFAFIHYHEKGQHHGHSNVSRVRHLGSGYEGAMDVLGGWPEALQQAQDVQQATWAWRGGRCRGAPAGFLAGQVQKSQGRRSPRHSQSPGYLDLLSGCGLEATLDYIWLRESSCGKDPRARRGFRGPAGERGEWQWTESWRRDIVKLGLTKTLPDPYGPHCRRLAGLWLQIRANEVEWRSIYDLHNLYKRGASGYRAWHEK